MRWKRHWTMFGLGWRIWAHFLRSGLYELHQIASAMIPLHFNERIVDRGRLYHIR